jgi:DNA invertase Pin-like site-specific DNA recombinase
VPERSRFLETAPGYAGRNWPVLPVSARAKTPLTAHGAMVRVAMYARVSTGGQSPEMQLSELRDYCRCRGWEITSEYVDHGISGTRERRPQLDQLMAGARQRRFDAVLVWKLDRFGRSLKHLVNALAEFEALGIAFVSLRDNLDLSTPAGRLMFQIIGAMAEFERALICERVKAGILHARARGKRIGRPPCPVDAEKVRRLRAEGKSLRVIAGALGVPLGRLRRSLCPPVSKPLHEFTAQAKGPSQDGFEKS